MPALVRSITKKLTFSRKQKIAGVSYNVNETPVPPAKDEEDTLLQTATPLPISKVPAAEESTPEAVVVSSDEDSSDDDSQNAAEKYGYGEASPDSDGTSAADKYGYGEAFPDSDKIVSSDAYHRASLARRNSRRSIRDRRASIGGLPPTPILSENGVNDPKVPFHPHRTPRRSSMKGSSPAAAARRASISASTCDAMDISILKEVDPKAVLEVKLPGRRGSITRRRSITFNEDVNVRSIQPAKTLASEPEKLWFQDDEYAKIKRKTRALLDKVDHDTGLVNGKKYCTRGLEGYMQPSHQRQATKFSAWDSVLLEQEMQRGKNKFCDESVSKLYKQTTTRSILEATRRANLDAEEVASFDNVTADVNQRSRRCRRASVA